MIKEERDFYLGKAHSIVETFAPGDDHKPYILDAIMDATKAEIRPEWPKTGSLSSPYAVALAIQQARALVNIWMDEGISSVDLTRQLRMLSETLSRIPE